MNSADVVTHLRDECDAQILPLVLRRKVLHRVVGHAIVASDRPEPAFKGDVTDRPVYLDRAIRHLWS